MDLFSTVVSNSKNVSLPAGPLAAAGRAHRRALFAEKLPPDSELSDLISTQRPP